MNFTTSQLIFIALGLTAVIAILAMVLAYRKLRVKSKEDLLFKSYTQLKKANMEQESKIKNLIGKNSALDNKIVNLKLVITEARSVGFTPSVEQKIKGLL